MGVGVDTGDASGGWLGESLVAVSPSDGSVPPDGSEPAEDVGPVGVVATADDDGDAVEALSESGCVHPVASSNANVTTTA